MGKIECWLAIDSGKVILNTVRNDEGQVIGSGNITIYLNQQTGERYTMSELPPGAMYWASWYDEHHHHLADDEGSELIREAVDRLIDQSARCRREAVLHEAAGIWKDRKDLPDFKAMRAEWDRN